MPWTRNLICLKGTVVVFQKQSQIANPLLFFDFSFLGPGPYSQKGMFLNGQSLKCIFWFSIFYKKSKFKLLYVRVRISSFVLNFLYVCSLVIVWRRHWPGLKFQYFVHNFKLTIYYIDWAHFKWPFFKISANSDETLIKITNRFLLSTCGAWGVVLVLLQGKVEELSASVLLIYDWISLVRWWWWQDFEKDFPLADFLGAWLGIVPEWWTPFSSILKRTFEEYL